MSKSKTIIINEDSSQQKDWVRHLSFIIIAVCIGLLLFLLGLMVWRSTNNNPVVYRVMVTTDTSLDSLKACNYIDNEQAESLIIALRAYDEQLTQKYQYLVEQKEKDSQVFYWGSLIVGVVIAVFDWFGFQSFTTIEDKAKMKATSVANRTAWKATKKYLDEKGENQISEAIKKNLSDDAIKKVKEQVINELNTIIENRLNQHISSSKVDDLETRIDDMEKSIGPNIDKAVNMAIQEVFSKYKRSVKGNTDNEEDKK